MSGCIDLEVQKALYFVCVDVCTFTPWMCTSQKPSLLTLAVIVDQARNFCHDLSTRWTQVSRKRKKVSTKSVYCNSKCSTKDCHLEVTMKNATLVGKKKKTWSNNTKCYSSGKKPITRGTRRDKAVRTTLAKEMSRGKKHKLGKMLWKPKHNTGEYIARETQKHYRTRTELSGMGVESILYGALVRKLMKGVFSCSPGESA